MRTGVKRGQKYAPPPIPHHRSSTQGNRIRRNPGGPDADRGGPVDQKQIGGRGRSRRRTGGGLQRRSVRRQGREDRIEEGSVLLGGYPASGSKQPALERGYEGVEGGLPGHRFLRSLGIARSDGGNGRDGQLPDLDGTDSAYHASPVDGC